MRYAAFTLAFALHAQIPPVTGPVTEQATLRYINIQTGTGADAKPGQQYSVHYTGWLRDGTQFDSSAGRDPLKFVQGRREVIPGFDAGFEGMKVGGKSELIFDIELVDVKDAPTLAAAADLLLPFNGPKRSIPGGRRPASARSRRSSSTSHMAINCCSTSPTMPRARKL